jgi:hypothetical protein
LGDFLVSSPEPGRWEVDGDHLVQCEGEQGDVAPEGDDACGPIQTFKGAQPLVTEILDPVLSRSRVPVPVVVSKMWYLASAPGRPGHRVSPGLVRRSS